MTVLGYVVIENQRGAWPSVKSGIFIHPEDAEVERAYQDKHAPDPDLDKGRPDDPIARYYTIAEVREKA